MSTFDLKQAISDTAAGRTDYTGEEFMDFLALVRGRYAQHMSAEFGTRELLEYITERRWITIIATPGRKTVLLTLS